MPVWGAMADSPHGANLAAPNARFHAWLAPAHIDTQ